MRGPYTADLADHQRRSSESSSGVCALVGALHRRRRVDLQRGTARSAQRCHPFGVAGVRWSGSQGHPGGPVGFEVGSTKRGDAGPAAPTLRQDVLPPARATDFGPRAQCGEEGHRRGHGSTGRPLAWGGGAATTSNPVIVAACPLALPDVRHRIQLKDQPWGRQTVFPG